MKGILGGKENPWTEEAVALLRTLYADGKSGSEIRRALMARLGLTFSRNAVIGKVHRLGLARRAEPAKRPYNGNKRVVAKPPHAFPKPKHVRNRYSVTRDALKVTKAMRPTGNSRGAFEAVLALEARDCRFPIGDPQAEDFAFCGRAQSYGFPYCEDHCRLAYQPSVPRGMTR